MTRRYGRAPGGERARESVPRNYGAQTSVVSTLSLSGPEAAWTLEGAVEADAFNLYIGRVLGPTLRRGGVLVLGNPGAHHASHFEEVAEECGAEVIWLAPYSPDFSPIELMRSKIKSSIRAAKARTREALELALVSALELVTDADCVGWFRHCGYQVTSNRN